MSDHPSISAIVISFEGMQFIADCLRTLTTELERYEHEIIVVDNHSTDGTIAFIKQNHPAVVLIENSRNEGFARAVNQGLRAARCDYIWLLNQDIRIRAGCLHDLLACLNEIPRPGVVGPRFVGFDGALQQSCRRLPTPLTPLMEISGLSRLFPRSGFFNGWKMGDFDHEHSIEAEQPMGSAWLFERRLIAEIGNLDERFAIFMNDVDFCARLIDRGYTNFYCAEAVIEHFVGGSVKPRKARMVWESHTDMFAYLWKRERQKSLARQMWSIPFVLLDAVLLILAAVPRSLYHLLRKVT
jgi:N-acetylglucosaminyl-diphospho-decaprenol L-rhamnosyltransferase